LFLTEQNIELVLEKVKKYFSNCLCALLGAVLASGAIYAQSDQANLVHFGDLLEVDVVGSYDYDWRGSLTPEGYLDGFDTIENQIYALCQTEGDLSAAVEKELAKTLRDPKVEVRILDRSNRAVAYLSGAVRSPKRFQIKRNVHLNELLVLSGGITDRSSGEISIFRPANLNCTDRSEARKDSLLRRVSRWIRNIQHQDLRHSPRKPGRKSGDPERRHRDRLRSDAGVHHRRSKCAAADFSPEPADTFTGHRVLGWVG
jgi:protein involved in polysaccharide export with SLBB domain